MKDLRIICVINISQKEELLDVLSQTVSEAKMLKDSVVAMDGFTGFTPVQNRLIGELLKVCDKIMLTVEIDRRKIRLSISIRISSLR